MSTNLTRLKEDLDKLLSQGTLLLYSLARDNQEEEFRKQLASKLKNNEVKPFLDKLPDFKTDYEAWYSQSVVLLKQLLPDRVTNFIGLYEKPKARKEITYANYAIQDYMQGITVRQHGSVVVGPDAAIPQYQQQLAIMKAAAKRFESSLFEIKQIVQADLFDSEIDAARELLKNKFLRAAGTIAGVVLEKHLAQLCHDRSIKISKKHPGIADLNELMKGNSVIDVAQWRHISMLADIRNTCTHSKTREPTKEQVADLIDGAEKVLKTIV